MTTDAHALDRLQAVFDAALELPPEERETFVARACAGDDALRDRVRRLLEATPAAEDSGFVRRAVRDATRSFRDGERGGRMLGPYRLVRELGHGGMGTVWLAERADEIYRALVAIKLVRGGFASADLARRFRDERQILADLRHPHIAALLDGGEAPDGTPYLVLEYIDGEPITRWVERRALSLGERLRAFRLVCAAVQHAHASLVVHRDIKPSNILVDANGVPKLLDFGIAKLLDPSVGSATTGLAQRLTPSYASPEQLRGERVTVATDVFSLGVLLHEMVTGAHPFAGGEVTTEEVRRRVLEEDPPRASETVRRRTGHPFSARAVAGDLDNIIAKAMRKEAAARYASVEQLSDDVGRMLSGEPVLARPASLGYRTRKFIGRHAGALGAAALLVLALTAGLGATAWQARRAEHARAVADGERRKAETALAQSTEVRNFLTSIFTANNPDTAGGREVTGRELLARGIARVDELSGQPAVQADVLEALAQVEKAQGHYAGALALFEREIALRKRLGIVDTSLIIAMNARGQMLAELGRSDSAMAAFRATLAVGIPELGAGDHTLHGAENNLALLLWQAGRDSEAEVAFRHLLRVLPPDDGLVGVVLNNLGLLLLNAGRYAEAEPLLREVLRLQRERDSTLIREKTAIAYQNLGAMLQGAGRYAEAEEALRMAAGIDAGSRGPDHPRTLDSQAALGFLLAMRGEESDLPEADSLLAHSATKGATVLGPTHARLARFLYKWGVVALRQGDASRAEARFDRALGILRADAGSSPRELARVQLWLGTARLARGTPAASAAALESLREGDSIARTALDSLDPVRNRVAMALAMALAKGGERAEADARYAPAVAALAARLGATNPMVREACMRGEEVRLEAAPCEVARRR